MNPIIKRLQHTLFTQPLGTEDPDPLNWNFSARIKELGPEFYQKIVSSHLILNMEYSLLGQQIRANLLGEQEVSEQQLTEQLVAAILLAELMEHVYQHYLMVPREVARFRGQQKTYRMLLQEIKGQEPAHVAGEEFPKVGISFSQQVRGKTIDVNLYRLLFIRSKRALDLIAVLDTSIDWFRYVVAKLDKFTDPFLPYVAWIFFIPRMMVNLFLLTKHLIPGNWMGAKEKGLDWTIRLQGQLLRRWFELGNDIACFSVGLINCFLLTGPLAPIGAYLSVAFFGYDMLLSAGRVILELRRLYQMRQHYEEMLTGAEQQDEIKQHLQTLDKQIAFEWLRLGSHLLTTVGIFAAMLVMSPVFAVNPLVPIAGAICLVLICLLNFALVSLINHYRPKDMIEIPAAGIRKLGFFAPKNSNNAELPEPNKIEEMQIEQEEPKGVFGCCH